MGDDKISLELLGTRVITLTAEMRDLRLCLGGLERRFGILESRFTAVEARIGGIETRPSAIESRVAGVEERMGSLLAVMVRIAERLDGRTPEGGRQ
jgi:hypothetical protein